MLFAHGVSITVDDPLPCAIEGLKEVDMHIALGPNEQILQFYVSNDGRHFINNSQGGTYDITQNPFQKDLDKLSIKGSPSRGPSNAPLTLIIFSDFECPQCKLQAESLREEVLPSFPTEVHLYFTNFPLETLHPWAKAAAVTGRCILEQGESHFWNYHDWIFTNQAAIKPDNFRLKVNDFVQAEKLDQMQFGHCMDDPTRALNEVNKEIAQGRALGVLETPTIFLNGRRLVGRLASENLKAIIQADLEYENAHTISLGLN